MALLLQRFANDRPALHGWLALAWLIALPLLAASVVLLPRNRPAVKLLPQRAWLPFAMFGLWLVVTGFHLFGVGYVHDFPWRKALAAPTLLAVVWAVLLKTYSPVPNLSLPAHRLLLCGPLATPFLALADTPIFFGLHSFNVLAYYLFWRRQRFAKSALALAALSLVLATAGIPDVWLGQLQLLRIDWVLGVAALTAMIPMFCSRDPRLGFLGAVGCSILSGLVVMRIDCAWQWAAQAGIIFVLVHSLRWQDDKFHGARNARYFLGTLWVFVSFVWIRSDDPQAIIGCMIAGVVVLVGYSLYWLVGRRWQPVCVAVYAGIVASLSPSLDLVEMLRKIPAGFLAVLSSVPLFVAGTIVALMRHRWQRDNSKL